jgi:hypothetical protein
LLRKSDQPLPPLLDLLEQMAFHKYPNKKSLPC